MKKKMLLLITVLLLINCEAIFVEDISDQSLELLAPSNNAEVTSGIVKFHWTNITDADNFLIQIATPSFKNASQIILDSITADTTIATSLEVGEYQWRVKAENSEYSTDFSTNNFTVN